MEIGDSDAVLRRWPRFNCERINVSALGGVALSLVVPAIGAIWKDSLNQTAKIFLTYIPASSLVFFGTVACASRFYIERHYPTSFFLMEPASPELYSKKNIKWIKALAASAMVAGMFTFALAITPLIEAQAYKIHIVGSSCIWITFWATMLGLSSLYLEDHYSNNQRDYTGIEMID